MNPTNFIDNFRLDLVDYVFGLDYNFTFMLDESFNVSLIKLILMISTTILDGNFILYLNPNSNLTLE